MFRKYQTTAEVFRPWYVDDWWYKKSSYTSTWNTYKWHLKAQSIDRTLDMTMFWKVFVFHTQESVEIYEWDRLLIDWIDYDVKGISPFDWVTFQTKQILLNKV